MSAAGTPPPAPTPAPAPAPAPAATWYADANLDTETQGYLQNRGWDKDVKAAALGAVKAHREAEKHLGVPADRLVRLPADVNDAAGWKGVWAKLGAPADAAGYDLAGIKFKDGSDLGDDFKNFFTSKALAANLPKTTAAQLAKDFVEFMDNSEASDAAEKSVQLETQKANLKKNWGSNEAVNMHAAKTAAARLDVKPEEVAALESVIGYDRVMELFRRVGQGIAEHQWNDSTNQSRGPAIMTREQATARKAELLGDKQWTDKWQGGDVVAQKEMLNLNALILGVEAS